MTINLDKLKSYFTSIVNKIGDRPHEVSNEKVGMKWQEVSVENTGHEMICDTYMVSNIASFDQLMRLYHQFKAKFQDSSLLMTLDDLGQAQYTSMHATMSHDLDNTNGHDLSQLDPQCFEDSEHLGYLSTQSEFFIRKENFVRKALNSSFEDACKRGLTIDNNELKLLETIHNDPMSFIDDRVLMQKVPVKNLPLTLCAFPNGYFTCDLNPFESHSVAQLLCDTYGYELFGSGASLLGFIKKKQLSKNEIDALVKDLSNLYNLNHESELVERLTELVENNNVFFLKYVEYLE